MNGPSAVTKDIVLVGAGHSHVQVLRMFGMRPIPGVRLTLITRQVHTPYSGMLPGFVAGHYGFDDVHIDTGPLSRFANARLFQDEVTGLDLDNRLVLCAHRPPVPYDLLSIDIGSTPSANDLPGVAQYAIPVKPIDQFLSRFETARETILARRGAARIGIVGGGAAGIELALSLQHRLRNDTRAAGFNPDGLQFKLFTASPRIVSALPPRARAKLARIATEHRIEIQTQARVIRIDDKGLVLEGDEAIALDAIFWTTQAAAAPWLKATGLALDTEGFIAVDDALQSLSHPGVFAAGDVASMRNHKLPKSGVYAVRQGPYLAENLRRSVEGTPLRHYRPQRNALYLVSTGEKYAVGARSGISFEGTYAWQWKDHIDREFMAKFNSLPEMPQLGEDSSSSAKARAGLQEISAVAMRCGGCGAKVGANVLSRALSDITPVSRDDVIVGLSAPDDAAVIDTGGPLLSVQTVDYFRSIIDDPYLFGRIAATHALGDIFAMGAKPQSALAIATIPYGPEAKVEAELRALMLGANEVLRSANCALVGGHTSEGAELAFGLSVHGLVAAEAVMRKQGMLPGDALILTKPIGTGTLLAAHMRARAKARWVMAALQQMQLSNEEAAQILMEHHAHAMTDITGFGLLGHLVEMVRASQVDVTLLIDQVPMLEGARECVEAGIFSSLQPQNVRLRRAVRNHDEANKHEVFPLLFDPQTSGGLLAALPANRASACIKQLRDSGYAVASIIGSVMAQSDSLEPVVIELPRSDA